MTLKLSFLKFTRGLLTVAAVAAAVGIVAGQLAGARQADFSKLPAFIWQDRGEIAVLDLRYGSGGPAHAPDPTTTFTFVAEDQESSAPKFDVLDLNGAEWKVKLGEESQAETAATRFLWAAGYFTDEDYYVADLTVKGLPTQLKRGQNFVSPGGIVHGARLERKRPSVKKIGTWDWFDNPFVGKRELNGLRVMMSFLNNWDLKQVNNSIYVVDGERHYVISDLGATFGNTGNRMTRSKNDPKDYGESKFIDKIEPDFVDFVLHSRPFFLGAITGGADYRERSKMEDITKHIPRADAKWIGQILSQLTDEQIGDAFRGAGYDADDVKALTTTIRQRIAALGAL